MQAHQEELVGSNDDHKQTMIMKGKRTKRPRPSVTSSSSSSSIGGCDGGGGGVAEEFYSVSSPTTSGLVYESTEEEEDMANCLIMLAQSDGPKRKSDEVKFKVENISSRKFSEISTTTNKAGFFVYECKTCNRSFPSFQALGGHRASHKKPKVAAACSAVVADDMKPVVLVVKDHKHVDEEHHLESHILALQVSTSNSKASCHGNKGNKIHGCSICGSEFSSGQALGGHMRRHRAVAAAVVAAAAATSGSKQAGVVSIDTTDIKPRNILSLDLNLPAPEDDLRDSKFQFVFSTPALVDCHY